MKEHGFVLLTVLGISAARTTPVTWAQEGPGRDQPGGPGDDDLVVRMMAFDKNKDGVLTRAEVTDERLIRLFERADANQDGAVTNDELTALARRESAGRRGGGVGGFGGPPIRPGEILIAPIQEMLKLTAEQRQQVADLQKQMDESLDKILTDAQKSQLKELRERGPGWRGGGPGRGGPPPGGRRPE